MNVLTPVRLSFPSFPLNAFKVVAEYIDPNSLVLLSHLNRRFRKEALDEKYWVTCERLLGTKNLKEYVALLGSLQPYLQDTDKVLELSVSQQAKTLSQLRNIKKLNGQNDEGLHRVNALITSLRQRAMSDAMATVRSGATASAGPLIEALIELGEQKGFVNMYLEHALSQSIASIDMSSMDPYVYVSHKEFDSEKFNIFLHKLEQQIREHAQQVFMVFPSKMYLEVWKALVQKFDNDILYKLIGHLCDIEISFVPRMFVCLTNYADNLEKELPQSPDFNVKALVLGPLIPLIKDCIAQTAVEFDEEAHRRIDQWERTVVESQQKTEDTLWSSVTKSEEKSNFLSSFKKVLVGERTPSASTPASPSLQVDSTPTTEFEAQTAVLVARVEGIKNLFDLQMVLAIIDYARSAFRDLQMFSSLKSVYPEAREQMVKIFVDLVQIVGKDHVEVGFERALKTLGEYDPKKHGRIILKNETQQAVEPLAIFAELVNLGDLIQQTIHLFFQQELVANKLIDPNDFGSPAVNAKRIFEQMLDDKVGEGLGRGIDVLIEQIDFILMTEQLGSDFDPLPGTLPELGPTQAAKDVVSLIQSHIDLIGPSIDQSLLDLFEQEVGMRLWNSICKHIKRCWISVDGAITLISDINWYHAFILSLKQKQLYPYYDALKQVAQLYLISPEDGKQLGIALSDFNRFKGVIPSDELMQFMQRRRDWNRIRSKVEKVMYGFGECIIS